MNLPHQGEPLKVQGLSPLQPIHLCHFMPVWKQWTLPGTTSQGQLLWHLCVKRYSRPSRATTLGNTLAKWRLELGMMHNDAWYCWYGTSSHKENQGDWNVKICDDDDNNDDDDDDANGRCKDVSTCVQIEKETPTNIQHVSSGCRDLSLISEIPSSVYA